MLQNKNFTKFLSLIIAICLWGYVVWTENPTISQSINNVPVEIRNLSSLGDRGLVLLGDHNYTVDVKLQGKKKDIGTITANDITATIDVGGYGAGQTEVTVNVHTLDNAGVIEVKPNRFTITIDEIITSESNIRLGMTGSIPENAEVGEFTSSFESAQIKGASSLVNTVSYLAANINIGMLTEEEAVQSVKLVPTNTRGEEVYGVTVSPGTVDISSRIYAIKEVPLSITVNGEVPEGYDVEHITVPDDITIRGNGSALENVRGISGSINIEGMTESGRVPVSLVLPSGVSLSSENAAISATVTIENLNAPDEPDVPQDGSGQDENNQSEINPPR